jgi:hypothetical protein
MHIGTRITRDPRHGIGCFDLTHQQGTPVLDDIGCLAFGEGPAATTSINIWSRICLFYGYACYMDMPVIWISASFVAASLGPASLLGHTQPASARLGAPALQAEISLAELLRLANTSRLVTVAVSNKVNGRTLWSGWRG